MTVPSLWLEDYPEHDRHLVVTGVQCDWVSERVANTGGFGFSNPPSDPDAGGVEVPAPLQVAALKSWTVDDVTTFLRAQPGLDHSLVARVQAAETLDGLALSMAQVVSQLGVKLAPSFPLGFVGRLLHVCMGARTLFEARPQQVAHHSKPIITRVSMIVGAASLHLAQQLGRVFEGITLTMYHSKHQVGFGNPLDLNSNKLAEGSGVAQVDLRDATLINVVRQGGDMNGPASQVRCALLLFVGVVFVLDLTFASDWTDAAGDLPLLAGAVPPVREPSRPHADAASVDQAGPAVKPGHQHAHQRSP